MRSINRRSPVLCRWQKLFRFISACFLDLPVRPISKSFGNTPVDVQLSIPPSALTPLSWRLQFVFSSSLRHVSSIGVSLRTNGYIRFKSSHFVVNTNSRGDTGNSLITRCHYCGYSKLGEGCHPKNHSEKTADRSAIRRKYHYHRSIWKTSFERDYSEEKSDEETRRSRWWWKTEGCERVTTPNLDSIDLSIYYFRRPRKKPVSSTEKENAPIDHLTHVALMQMNTHPQSSYVQYSQNTPYQHPGFYQNVANSTDTFVPSHQYNQSILSQQKVMMHCIWISVVILYVRHVVVLAVCRASILSPLPMSMAIDVNIVPSMWHFRRQQAFLRMGNQFDSLSFLVLPLFN